MVLEATLTSTRPGVPDSSTILPIGDLMDRLDTDAPEAADACAEPIAIPVGASSVAVIDTPELAFVGAAAGGSDGPATPMAGGQVATLRP